MTTVNTLMKFSSILNHSACKPDTLHLPPVFGFCSGTSKQLGMREMLKKWWCCLISAVVWLNL